MAYASTMPLYCTCSVSQRCKKTRAIIPFGGRFVAEIFVQNFKWRVSERGADVNYILIQLLYCISKDCWVIQLDIIIFRLFLPFKSFPSACVHPYCTHGTCGVLHCLLFCDQTRPNLRISLVGTIVPLNFLVGYYCSIVASTPQPMAYASTMPLYCTCSVSQRCKKTRAILPFGGRFLAEIFVQNFKWRVFQRGADVNYILIQLLLLYLKNLLSYTAWHNCFQAFFAVQILPIHIFIMRVYTMPL